MGGVSRSRSANESAFQDNGFRRPSSPGPSAGRTNRQSAMRLALSSAAGRSAGTRSCGASTRRPMSKKDFQGSTSFGGPADPNTQSLTRSQKAPGHILTPWLTPRLTPWASQRAHGNRQDRVKESPRAQRKPFSRCGSVGWSGAGKAPPLLGIAHDPAQPV